MKILAMLALTVFAIACDPYGFGFRKNPTYVLDQALKSIQNRDDLSFIEISGKEALCVYGNKEGMTYLHEKVTADVQNMQLKHKEIGELKASTAPEYVGFWSYLKQRYVVEIQQKSDRSLLGTLVVDCNFGATGEKKASYLNIRDPKKFKMKECRLTKIIPATFKPLSVTGRCQNLVVDI